MSDTLNTWVQQRSQIKYLLYELCLKGRIDRKTLGEQFNALNSVAPVVRCEDCKYYDEIEDADVPGYRECHYFSSRSTAHYMLSNDGCTCGKRKEENADIPTGEVDTPTEEVDTSTGDIDISTASQILDRIMRWVE